MENILMLKKMARSVVFAGIVIFGATGAAHAAGAGDQTGQYGDMSGHGGPVDKKGSSAGQSGGQGAASGQGSERPRSSNSGQGGSGREGSSSGGHPWDREQVRPAHRARERVLPGNRMDQEGATNFL